MKLQKLPDFKTHFLFEQALIATTMIGTMN